MNLPNTPLPWTVREGLVPSVECPRGTVATVASQRYSPIGSIPASEESALLRMIAGLPRLIEAAELGAFMLAIEARSHEESGNPKRRTYVAPIRDAVERIRRILKSIDPE